MVRSIRDLQHAFHRRGRERRLRQCRMTVEALEERTLALSYEARARGLARRANLGADNSNDGHAPRVRRDRHPRGTGRIGRRNLSTAVSRFRAQS